MKRFLCFYINMLLVDKLIQLHLLTQQLEKYVNMRVKADDGYTQYTI